MISSYEQQLEVVKGLPRSRTEDERHIAWGVTDGVIGLARTPKGQIEIFLPGPPLEARLRRVRNALEHQQWFRANGGELMANRILLPAAGHFEQVAAFLSTELMRNGATADLPNAFAQTEPLIEMAIHDLLLADESFLGLCGEMLVLNTLVRAASMDRVDEIVDSWKGHREGARDFQVRRVGVEVKTTARGTSSHMFRGVHQLEVGHGVDGAEEASYLLMSVGLEWTRADESANTSSLPELVDGVIERLDEALGPPAGTFVDDLVARIAEYGSPTTVGYDHRTMSESVRFGRRFRLVFARGYDMTDEAIRLLTTDDMRARPFIEVESLHMRVSFPNQIGGDINPVVGLANCAHRILGAT